MNPILKKKLECCQLLLAEVEIWNQLFLGLTDLQQEQYNKASEVAIQALREVRNEIS